MKLHPTTKHRNGEPSRPAREVEAILPKRPNGTPWKLLDYGCGDGSDAYWFNQRSDVFAFSYDPISKPHDYSDREFDVVTCSYVLNVIEDLTERADVVRKCLNHATTAAIFTVRTDVQTIRSRKAGAPYQEAWTWEQWWAFLINIMFAGYSFCKVTIKKIPNGCMFVVLKEGVLA